MTTFIRNRHVARGVGGRDGERRGGTGRADIHGASVAQSGGVGQGRGVEGIVAYTCVGYRPDVVSLGLSAEGRNLFKSQPPLSRFAVGQSIVDEYA